MTTPEPLSPDQLYRHCDPATLPFGTTAELDEVMGIVGQQRATEAVRFGVGMKREGYNIFALGPAGLGKHTFVRHFLEGQAAREPKPCDWVYVHNFEVPHKPKAVRMPAGRGAKLAQNMAQLVEELQAAIPAVFDSDEYRLRAGRIDAEFGERQEKAFSELGQEAAGQGIALLHTPSGFSFAPAKDGEVLGSDEYAKLPKEEQERIVRVIAELEGKLERLLRQIPRWRRERREQMKRLNREVTLSAVGHLIDDLEDDYAGLDAVRAHLDRVRDDVMDNVDLFRKRERHEGPPGLQGEEPDPFRRYRVSLLVEHGESDGAPVVFDDHPTYQSLVGRVEHIAQFGALLTDFTLIKPGSLHRANGGYLLLDVFKLLSQPFAWEGLKRALRSREIRIESLGQMYSLISTVSLEPEPIPLELKVVLFGDRLWYYLLCEYDPEFGELFKVAADFEEEVERNESNGLLFARLVASLARQEKLMPLGRDAVARVIEHAARLVGDAERLSIHMESLSDLLREADYWAREAERGAVSRADVERAIETQIHRADRIRERVHEAILRGTVLVDTDGARAGQVNGLAVFQIGNFAFAQPTRISATTRLGDGAVVDIQREASLGGSIHSKGVMILAAFFAERYAKRRPLALAASLAFEQTYGMVEGDSASVGELCALMSSLADVPVKQSLAVTGSVNQHGEVQAIGAVNEKIEGFFDICAARGLTGRQGVVIPRSNVKHLMLREDVVAAVRDGRFRVHAVETVDEAVELLTGIASAEIDARVATRLEGFVQTRQKLAGLVRPKGKGIRRE